MIARGAVDLSVIAPCDVPSIVRLRVVFLAGRSVDCLCARRSLHRPAGAVGPASPVAGQARGTVGVSRDSRREDV